MYNYFFYDTSVAYPDSSQGYSPSTKYPEYQFGIETIQESANTVYDAIRNIFMDIGLDKNNFGKKRWNPLGEYIKPGQRVLIKPNFVMHKNGSSNPEDMESLVTHPSVIRCIIDYCLIALKGKGSLIIADSPVKDCDFSLLMKNGEYNTLVDFYQKNNVSPMPQFFDLRGPEEEGGQYQQYGTGVLVNLAEKSFFYSCNHDWKKYRIPNYDYRKVRNHHHGLTQEYLINSIVLDADVIISLPKPKTHRKNGYTGALKNFVGVNYSKEYLPHHTAGAISDGGDEYKIENQYKKEQSRLREKLDIVRTTLDNMQKEIEKSNNKFLRFGLQKVKNQLTRYQRNGWRRWSALGKQDDDLVDAVSDGGGAKAREGSWYGNDTLWRTVLDLNLAVEYADKSGLILETRQRKILYLGDMVVAGEKEGPMSPSPKKSQAFIFSDNPVAFDSILVKFMGFDWKKFKGLVEAVHSDSLFEFDYEDISIQSNDLKYCGCLRDVNFGGFTSFEPSEGWKGHIELKKQE